MRQKLYVIVPVYRAEKFVEKAVHSVLRQRSVNSQILLIDDGSPDHSGRICDALAQTHGCVQVFHQKNGGMSAARNRGIEAVLSTAAEDDYIAFLDADDFWLAQFFPDPAEAMDSDLIAYSSAACNQKGNRFRVLHRFKDETLFLSGANTQWINQGTFASFFYRVGLVRKYRLRFLPGVQKNEDVIFWRQASFCARSVRFSSKFLYAYRHNPASATHSTREHALHIPNAWHTAGAWADQVPCFSAGDKLRWRLECERTCGARLLEAARIMSSQGCSAEQIQATVLDGPLGRYLQALEPEDLAQWQQEDLRLIRADIQKMIKRYRLKGIVLDIARQLLRLPPVRLVKEYRQFPLHTLDGV